MAGKSFPPAPPGWTFYTFCGHNIYESDERSKPDPEDGSDDDPLETEARFRVYASNEGTFSISEHQTWVAGIYADLETAIAAFDAPDAVLCRLQDAANARGDHVITAADLAAAVGGLPK